MKLSTFALIVICCGLCLPAARADYAGEVMQDRPVAWWRFGDPASGNGAAVRDAAGKHPGIYHGNTTVGDGVPGIGGKAALFDGTTAYVEVPHHTDFALDTLSVECWFQTKQAWQESNWPASAKLISKGTEGNASSDWVILGGAAAGVQGCVMAQPGPTGGNDAVVASPGGLNDDKWHHLVWTRAPGVNQLFVDGVKLTETDDSGGSILNERAIQIGGDPFLTGKSFAGRLAEVAIYQTALDESRVVAHLKAAGVSPARPAIVAPPKPLATLAMATSNGLGWELWRGEHGWTLGQISLHGKPLENPAAAGVLALRDRQSGELRWLPADHAERLGPNAARLTGLTKIGDVTLRFGAEITLQENLPAAAWTASWSVDKNLGGWEVCLAYQDGCSNDWRVQSYPWAGNSTAVSITPMRYCGVPGALVYRPDQSLVALFAIANKSDYLNPATWTGTTEFHFASRRMAPQFRVGGGKLEAGTNYEMPLQLFLSDAGNFPAAISGIMQTWMKVNNYQVDDSLKVRTPQEAFVIALEGRRKMASWKPGIGYEHHRGTPFIYVGNNPYIACYEYRLYEITGDKLWRDRAFEQIDFAIKGQQPSGVFHTSWYFGIPEFCSRDWSHDGYKVDINAWMVRYILQTWQRVKEKEGLDRQDWYQAAMASLNWVLAQQNPDGGFPQVVAIDSGKKSESVVCGRALVGLPIIAKITGDERCLRASAEQERFMRRNVEGRFWYTGAHPDLPPGDFEQDSIYAMVEYWLDKHDRTGDQECLDRAVANAYYGLLYWCPKQLSWVKAPTQCAHSEQQHFNQYSVYCYGNRKIQCLDRLFKKTGNPLFEQLRNRVMQLNFYTQIPDGPYQGAMTEAIADPWLERNQGFEWRGSPYTSELVSDLMLQLIEMNLVTKP
ncbi:MAG: LamG domain-containing protein [Verrucomicrobia bacterium]|nr:LamG domain-containing protein [Verrucomicrobiota bacterium]